MQKPLLYTYRRCPYAIRARMALLVAGMAFDAHEVRKKLNDLAEKNQDVRNQNAKNLANPKVLRLL